MISLSGTISAFPATQVHRDQDRRNNTAGGFSYKHRIMQ
jgi:hypothetical protein